MWAAEAVCERPGSPAGLQCALCPRGVVRLWPGVQRGGYRSTLRKRPFKRGGRASHVSTSTAAPACGGEVGGCSGGVQRLGNLGGRAGARAGRDCAEFELGKECRCFARVYARALRVGAREHLQLVSQEKGWVHVEWFSGPKESIQVATPVPHCAVNREATNSSQDPPVLGCCQQPTNSPASGASRRAGAELAL